MVAPGGEWLTLRSVGEAGRVLVQPGKALVCPRFWTPEYCCVVEVRLLGPVEVVSDGRAVDLGAKKPRGLFAMLALEVNRPVIESIG